MIWPKHLRIVFRMISACLAGIFLFQQVSWAGDLTEYAIDKLNAEQSQTFAPAYLRNQQALHENLISEKQAIEDAPYTSNLASSIAENIQASGEEEPVDLRGPKGGSVEQSATGDSAVMAEPAPSSREGALFSVTTESGDIIHYKNSRIEYIETEDSAKQKIVIRRIELLDLVDGDNNLVNAEITYADGSAGIVLNGKVSRITKPDGAIFYYNDEEKLSSILYPDGRTVSFSYSVMDADASLVTVLTDSDKISYYDSDNRLKRVVFNDGKTIEYNSGVIFKITESDLSRYIFDIKANPDATFTSTLAQYITPDGAIYRYAVDEDGALISITVKKGVVTAAYNKDGVLTGIIKDGEVITQVELDEAIADIDRRIQYARALLAQAQADLNLALIEEEDARSDHNTAQADVAAKQAAYDNAARDRQAKGAALGAASANLSNARSSRIAAENALSDGSPYVVSSYAANTDSAVTLNQYKNFINDQFDSYDSALWYKMVDSLVTIGGGQAVLNGTGANYNAAFLAKQAFSRFDRPALSTKFKVSSTSGGFIAALDGYTAANSYRRVGIYVYGGRIYLQTVTGTTTGTPAIPVPSARANTNYNLEFETTPQDIKVYLWESDGQRPVKPSYVYTLTDWTTVRPRFLLYSGAAAIDYTVLSSPNLSSIHDSNSWLVKDAYQDGGASTYSYSSGKISVSEYKKYLDSPRNLATDGLWYTAAPSLVGIVDGIAALNGTGSNYNASFYSNQSFARTDDVIIRSSFNASSTSGNFIAALDGSASSGAYRRVGVIMQGGRVHAQTVNGSTVSRPKTLVASAKANTNYTVEFEVSAQNIKIYLWESSRQRPTAASYTYTLTDWTTVRPYYAVYSGNAAVNNVYINYIPRTRTVLSGSADYARITARNQLVRNLRDALANEAAGQTAYDSAAAALDNARLTETEAEQNRLSAQNVLAAKQVVLDGKVAARQAVETTISGLNTEIPTLHAEFERLNAILSVISIFPREDAVLRDANTGIEAASILYDVSRRVKEIREIDGDVKTDTDGDGLIDNVLTGSGSTIYSYDLTSLDAVSGITAHRDGITRIYGAGGKLKNLVLNDFALDENTIVTYKDGRAVEAEKTIPGTGRKVRMRDFVYDGPESNNLIGYTVYQDDGARVVYKNNVIDQKINKDGSVIKYKDERIDTLEEPDGKVYRYIYGEDAAGKDTTRKELIRYRLTDGGVLSLNNGVIESLTLANGRKVANPVFDSDGALKSGGILLDGGAVGRIEDYILDKIILSDGAEIVYENGLIKTVMDNYGNQPRYSYAFDGDGGIEEIAVIEEGKERKHTAEGVLKSISSDAGKAEFYPDGRIKSIRSNLTDYLLVDPVFDEDGRISDAVVIYDYGFKITFIDGRVRKTESASHTRYFDEDGAIIYDASSGIEAYYTYERSPDGKMVAIWVRHNAEGVFLTEGLADFLERMEHRNFISIATLYSVAEQFGYTGYATSDFGSIDIIDTRYNEREDPDMQFVVNYSRVEETTSMTVNAPLHSSFNSMDYMVSLGTRKDAGTAFDAPIQVEFYRGTSYEGDSLNIGSRQILGAMYLSELWRGESMFFKGYPSGYSGGTLVLRILNGPNPEQAGTFYISEMTVSEISSQPDPDRHLRDGYAPKIGWLAAIKAAPGRASYSEYVAAGGLFAGADIADFYGATPLYVQYDAGDKLTEIKRTDGSVVDFADSRPNRITIEADQSFIDYEYDGFALRGASIFPKQGLEEPDIVLEYEANRIRKAVKGDIVYTYDYKADSDGKELTIVTNESTKYVYRYKNDQLLDTTSDEDIVTTYSYDKNRIAGSRVTYRGKLLETFSYSYADELTIVTDEKLVRRTYDRDDRLVFLETPDGLGYKHNYTRVDDAGQGRDLLEVELYQARGKDGVIVYHKEGNVDYVMLKDGTKIDLNDSDGSDTVQGMTLNDGLIDTVIYKTGEVAAYLRDGYGRLESIRVDKDGVARWYNLEGELIRLRKSPTETYLYGYTRKENGSTDKVMVSKVTMKEVGGGVPLVKLSVFSAGRNDGWDDGIFVNDRVAGTFNVNWGAVGDDWLGNGYDVAVVDAETGAVLKAELFQPYRGEADQMAAFIETVEEGDYVVIAIGEEGSWGMNERAYQAIESLGSSLIRNVTYPKGHSSSWAMIGRKGAAAGTAIEEYRPSGAGPVALHAYSVERYYYDADGNYLKFDEVNSAPEAAWYSMRPTEMTDDIEPFSINPKGDVSGYKKNFNPLYPDSGFIRIWDTIDYTYSPRKMAELEAFAANKAKKAVYYDERYQVKDWLDRNNYALNMKDYFAAKGYDILDANQLRQWLKTSGPDSIVLMSQDVAPATILSRHTSDSAARDYLEAGGTMVWQHDIPFHYISYSDGGLYYFGEYGQRKALGIMTAILPRNGDKYAQSFGAYSLEEYSIPQGQEPLEKDLLHFDFSVNYRDIRWDRIKASIGYELERDTAVVAEYDSEGSLTAIAKADRTVSFYDKGKVDFVSDIHGDVLVDYTYDDSGDLAGLRMGGARRDLDWQMRDARGSILEEKALQLEELAVQKGLITEEVRRSYAGPRGAYYAQRSALENNLRDLEDMWVWPWQRSEKNANMDRLRGAIGQIDAYISELNAREAADLAQLNDEFGRVASEIDAQVEEALYAVGIQEATLLKAISIEEAKPLLTEYYRALLGRDAGTEEIESYTRLIEESPTHTLNIENLKTNLRNSSEYIARTGKIGLIRGEIEDSLRHYIALDSDGKESFLAALNLLPDDAVELAEADITKIAEWLSKQNIHFGRSAGNILSELLDDRNIPYDYYDLIRDAILIDILTGSVNAFTDGELLISAYALSKVASLHGLDLTPVKLTFEELKSAVTGPGAKKVVVLIGGNHYVIVTSVDEASDTITYIETSKGEHGESVTAKISDFKGVWKEGFAIEQKRAEDSPNRLSDYAAKKVRGACFWLLLPIISALIQALLVVIEIVVIAIEAIVIPLIQFAFSALVGFIGGLAQGAILIAKALFMGIEFVGMSLFKGFAAFFAGGLFVSGAKATLASTIVTAVTKTVVGVAVSFGINAGLDALGVNPVVSRFVSAFLTGGIVGAIGNPAIGFFSFANALGALAMQGVNYLGAVIDLPPPITSALSIAAGALTEGLFDIKTFSDTVTKVAVNLASEMTFAGIQILGDYLGVDPRISYLAGIGIRSSLQAGLTDGFKPDVLWDGIVDGLTDPRTLSIAFSVAGDAIGLDPLYNNIIINLAAGAVEGALENPQDIIYGIFRGMMDNFIQTSVRALTLGLYDPVTGWTEDWQAGYYIAHIIDFIDVIEREGIVSALEHYMSTIFRDDAIRSINEAGGITDFLIGRAEIVYEDGVAKKKVNFAQNENIYLDPNTDEMIGRDYDGIRERGSYGVNPLTGGFGLIDGVIEEDTGSGTIAYHVRDSVIIERIDLSGAYGSFSIVASNPETGLQLDSNGLPIGGIVEDFGGVQLFEYEYVDESMYMKLNIQDPDLPDGTSISLQNISDADKQQIIDYYLLSNGINNKNPYGSPGYMDGFMIDLANADPNAEDFTLIPLYNEFYGVITLQNMAAVLGNDIYAAGLYRDFIQHGYIDENGKIQAKFLELRNASELELSADFMSARELAYQLLWDSCDHLLSDVDKWLRDVYGDSDVVTNKIIKKLEELPDKFGGNYPPNMVGFNYSGAGDPFIQAINQQIFNGQYLDVNSLVLVGTPIRHNRVITNPNVQTLITINGDSFFGEPFKVTDYGIADSPDIPNKFKIVIKNATHTDYFYDPDKPNANDAFKMKVSRFIAEVTARSRDTSNLIYFLDRPGISKVNGKYIVDVNEVTYD